MDLLSKKHLPNQLFRKFSPLGTSLTVQWLKSSVFPLQGEWVLFLVGELRSCVHCAVAKKEKKKEKFLLCFIRSFMVLGFTLSIRSIWVDFCTLREV